MDFIFWGAVAILWSLIVFVFGYTVAARELGKEVTFWKDCSNRQKATILGYMEEVDHLQKVIKGD